MPIAETKVEIKSLCGMAKLTSAIFGIEEIELKKRWELPLPRGYCRSCGKKTYLSNKSGLCHSCRFPDAWIELQCEECGRIFKRSGAVVRNNFIKDNYNHIFCGKTCQGKWLGKNYGFEVSPLHRGHAKRKYDYDAIWRIHLDTGYGALRLSRLLMIPESTLSMILAKLNKQQEGGKAEALVNQRIGENMHDFWKHQQSGAD